MCRLPSPPMRTEAGGIWGMTSTGVQMMSSSSSRVSMCLLMNSKDEKKMALTAHERTIETPRPRYMCRLKNSIFGEGSTFWPLEYMSELRWYTLLAESIGSVGRRSARFLAKCFVLEEPTYESPGRYTTEATCHHDRQWVRIRVISAKR